MTRICTRCHRETTPPPSSSRPRERGKVYYCSKGLCRSCYSSDYVRRRRLWLRPSTDAPMRYLTRSAPGEIDDVAVDRALVGDRLKLTPAEIDEVVRRLTATRHSARQIAEVLGCTARTVQRHRARLSRPQHEHAA